ncbi:MAG: hypothetical protein NT009_08690 [Proteobacteria bacterium]|nr:hypothetical protein [Pseudomonadota bacterium]
MPQKERIDLIKKIEGEIHSKIITYITGDRQPFPTQIADDAILLIRKHLDSLGKQKIFGLFIYSRGGEMIAPLRLVRLIREYCDYFEVLIPYRAHSAATLLCLGADKIIMGKLAELSPVDPTTGHPFNPDDPTDPNKQKKIPISVEDLTSYFLLAKEKAYVRDEQMVNVFNELTNKIHPLALGNVYRSHRMIRLLARKLLSMHMNEEKEKHRIDEIIKKLTEELCIHGYLISREEAEKDVRLNIEKPKDSLEDLMWSLYKIYERDMELTVPFEPVSFLGGAKERQLSYYGAIIESERGTDAFLINGVVKAKPTPQGPIQTMVNILPSKWVEINE